MRMRCVYINPNKKRGGFVSFGIPIIITISSRGRDRGGEKKKKEGKRKLAKIVFSFINFFFPTRSFSVKKGGGGEEGRRKGGKRKEGF